MEGTLATFGPSAPEEAIAPSTPGTIMDADTTIVFDIPAPKPNPFIGWLHWKTQKENGHVPCDDAGTRALSECFPELRPEHIAVRIAFIQKQLTKLLKRHGIAIAYHSTPEGLFDDHPPRIQTDAIPPNMLLIISMQHTRFIWAAAAQETRMRIVEIFGKIKKITPISPRPRVLKVKVPPWKGT